MPRAPAGTHRLTCDAAMLFDLRTTFVFLAALLTGCFIRADVGAQRSNGAGSWTGSASVVAGVQLDIGRRLNVGAGVARGISGFENEDGDGYVITGPLGGVVRVRVVDTDSGALAVVADGSLPGSVKFAPGGEGAAQSVKDATAIRGYLGGSYERAFSRRGGVVRLFAGAGVQGVAISGSGFANTTTLGPAITLGWSVTGKAVAGLLDTSTK